MGREFGLRGRLSLLLDEVVVPVRDTGDYAGSSPFVSRRITMDGQTSPGVVARFAGYLIQPGANTLLVINKLQAGNAGVAGVRRFNIQLLRPVDVAAVNVSATAALALLTAPRVLATGFYPQVAATASLIDHNVANPGAQIGQILLPSNAAGPVTLQLDLPHGIILDGGDPAGLGGVAIMATVANTAMDAGFVGAEYPLIP